MYKVENKCSLEKLHWIFNLLEPILTKEGNVVFQLEAKLPERQAGTKDKFGPSLCVWVVDN